MLSQVLTLLDLLQKACLCGTSRDWLRFTQFASIRYYILESLNFLARYFKDRRQWYHGGGCEEPDRHLIWFYPINAEHLLPVSSLSSHYTSIIITHRCYGAL